MFLAANVSNLINLLGHLIRKGIAYRLLASYRLPTQFMVE